MTERIHEFLRRREHDGPCLVVDLEVVRDNYRAFANALPDTRVFYAVKANPSPQVLELLAGLGSCFDIASIAEIEMVLAAGATPTEDQLQTHVASRLARYKVPKRIRFVQERPRTSAAPHRRARRSRWCSLPTAPWCSG